MELVGAGFEYAQSTTFSFLCCGVQGKIIRGGEMADGPEFLVIDPQGHLELVKENERPRRVTEISEAELWSELLQEQPSTAAPKDVVADRIAQMILDPKAPIELMELAFKTTFLLGAMGLGGAILGYILASL